MRYWPPLQAETSATHSLPHPQNERQLSVNDVWSCKLGNLSVAMGQEFIYEVVVAVSGNTVQHIFGTLSRR